MPSWKLTVRDGADVSHAGFDDLIEGVVAMREQALAIRAKGPAKPVSGFKDFEPKDQVLARLQLSGGRWPRKRQAGIDVRGDGTLMPFRGTVRREELDPSRHETPFDLVRETLESDG